LSSRTGNSSRSLTAEVDSSVPVQSSLVRQPGPKGGQSALVRSAAFAGLGDAGPWVIGTLGALPLTIGTSKAGCGARVVSSGEDGVPLIHGQKSATIAVTDAAEASQSRHSGASVDVHAQTV